MHINARKVAQIVWIAGAVVWIGNEIYELYQERKSDRKIDSATASRLAAIQYAAKVLDEELDAGHYRPTSMKEVERDMEGLTRIYDPENK